jgi:hypothetical protein
MLAFLGFAAFEFAGRVSHTTASQVAATRVASPVAGATATSVRTARAGPPRPPRPPRPARTPGNRSQSPRKSSRSPAPTPAAPQVLTPASAAAFGPKGTADGDNPQMASLVLTDPAEGWTSDWYATAQFGELKTGTGLLLDMGRPVTITSVRIDLGATAGANLQLSGGSSVGDLTALSTAANVSGSVDLALGQPVLARYVLFWFTRLPPDNAGTYQVAVHGITVRGEP